MIKKFLTYGIGYVGSALIGILTVPFLTRVLSPEEYGKGSLFITLVTLMFYVCNAGLLQGYERFFYDKKYTENKERLFFQALLSILIIFCVTFLLLFFLKSKFIRFFFGSNDISIYYLLIVGVLFYILNSFFVLAIRMKQYAGLFSLAQIFNGLGYLLAIVFFYYFYGIDSFMLIIYSQITMLIVVTLFTAILNLETLRNFDIKSTFKIEELNNLLRYSWPFVFSLIVLWGMQYIDRIFLIQLSSFNDLGIYSASYTLIAPLFLFQSAFAILWVPIGMNIIINHPYKGRFIYSVIFKNITSIVLLSMVLIYCFKGFIPLFLGSNFSESANIFIWFMLIPLFTIADQLLNAGIFSSKKTHWTIVATIFGFIFNIVFCILYIPTYGAIGAAISLVVGNFVYILVKLYSCNIHYKYYIDYKHFFGSVLMFVICFIFCYIDTLHWVSWVFLFFIFIYQSANILNKTNIRSVKVMMKCIQKIND